MSRLFSGLLLSCFVLGFAVVAFAAGQGGWNVYESSTGLFSVEVPGDPKVEESAMRISPEFKVYAQKFSSMIDQRDYKRSLKRYNVSIVQTWGPGLKKTKRDYMQRDLDQYLKSFAESGLQVEDSGISEDGDYMHYHATYEDKKLGLQGVRARVYYTDTARLEQSISGPNQIMTESKVGRFFDSFHYNRGYTKSLSQFTEWESLESQLGAYTMPHPHETSVYFPSKPVVAGDQKSESVKMVFTDPIRQQNMYYNIYAYRLNQKVTPTMVKQVLAKQHVRKYNPRQKSMDFTNLQRAGYAVLENETVIRQPPDALPYLNLVTLRAQYHGNILVVQEILGHHPLVRSLFAKNLMDLIEFTPSKAIAQGKGEVYVPPPNTEDVGEVDER